MTPELPHKGRQNDTEIIQKISDNRTKHRVATTPEATKRHQQHCPQVSSKHPAIALFISSTVACWTPLYSTHHLQQLSTEPSKNQTLNQASSHNDSSQLVQRVGGSASHINIYIYIYTATVPLGTLSVSNINYFTLNCLFQLSISIVSPSNLMITSIVQKNPFSTVLLGAHSPLLVTRRPSLFPLWPPKSI